MKIMHVAEVVKGGVAAVINQLIEGQEDNNNVRVLVPNYQKKEINISEGKNLLTFKSKKRGLFSHVNLLLTFTYYLLKFKPDVVHIHSSFAGLICRLPILLMPWRKFKVIYCPHAFSFMIDNGVFKKKLYAKIEIALSLVTDKIICVSDFEHKEAINNGMNKRKLVTIYNGVKDRGDIKRNDWMIGGVLNVLFVGRFEKQKGYDLLEQAADFFQNEERIFFHLVGDFTDRDISEYINFKNVKNYGWLSHKQVQELYREADLLIMPSRWEGLPMAALEAMSAGLPIMASNCSAFPEIIKPEKNGVLFESGNIKDFIDTLFSLLCDNNLKGKVVKMSKSSHEIFLSKYESKKMLNSTYNLYQ